MDNIKLTVIIPVYNQEELISRALYSVPNRKDIEVIVVNDGSVDRTEEKIKEWLVDESTKNQKVFINRKENKGVSATVNEGLEKAKALLNDTRFGLILVDTQKQVFVSPHILEKVQITNKNFILQSTLPETT